MYFPEETHMTTDIRKDVQYLDYEGNADHDTMRDHILLIRLAELRKYDI